VNEVKEMFDREEPTPFQPQQPNQQSFGKRGGTSRPGTTTQGETMIEEEGKTTAWNRKRPTSANIMVSELKYKIETKNRSTALPRAVSRDGTTVRRPGQQQNNISSSPPPPTEEEMIWAELKDADELFINSKPYRSHPLHQFRQQNDRAKAEKIRDELRQKEEAATTAAADRERSNSPPITRQLTSPRTTTIMLLSHDIVTKNEQQPLNQPPSRAQSSQYPRGPLSPSQNPFLSIQNFDVPVNIISNNPADGLTKEAFEKQVFQQQKNHRRMIHIVENEILHQNEMKATTITTTKTTTTKTITATIPSALIPTESSTENNIKNNTFSVPTALTEQMKKQLTHYHDIMQQQQQQPKDGRPASASAPSPTQQQLINQYQRQFLSPDEDPASYSNQTSPRPLTREDAPVILQQFPRGTTPRGEEAVDSSSLDYTDGSTALPKIQWKAFMNSPPPLSAVVPLLDISNLEASQEMMSNEPQQQISAPFIVINGKHFKNINRVSLEAPPHPIHMNDAENPSMKVNSNTASHNQLPQHPSQYKHNLQYFVRKAPLIEPSQKPVIINPGHHLHQNNHNNNNTTHTSNPPQFMIMNNHQLNTIQRANHQNNNNHHNPTSAPSTDEVDHDFMNIADDIYLNDHLYFAHKYHNVQGGGGGKEAEDDSALVFNIQQVATAFDRQQDTVQINKNIVSDRIDRKHLQGFRFPSPKHQPQQQQQQQPPPVTAPWNAENAYFNDTLPTIDDNHNYNQQQQHHQQQRAISSQGRSKSATGTTRKKKSKELKIDSNKMVLTPKTPTIRPVPIIPKSKSGKFESGDPQQQQQQPKTASVFSMNNLSVANETSLIAIEVPSSPSGNGNNLLSTPFLKPAPPDGFNSLMVNRSASVETAGRGEDLFPIGIHVNVHHTAMGLPSEQPQQPQPPSSSRVASQPVAPAMAVVSRPQSAANTSRSNSRPSSAAIGRKLVSFNK
jgi:hypothetical protein